MKPNKNDSITTVSSPDDNFSTVNNFAIILGRCCGGGGFFVFYSEGQPSRVHTMIIIFSAPPPPSPSTPSLFQTRPDIAHVSISYIGGYSFLAVRRTVGHAWVRTSRLFRYESRRHGSSQRLAFTGNPRFTEYRILSKNKRTKNHGDLVRISSIVTRSRYSS